MKKNLIIQQDIDNFCSAVDIDYQLTLLIAGKGDHAGVCAESSGGCRLDASALKVAKMAISTSVPVIGGILSDASEAVLVSAGVLKNAAGIYGILTVIALLCGPFLRIGIQYLMIKATAAMCGSIWEKQTSELIGDFATAMGLLLSIVSTQSIMLLISTVCFMKGVG